MSLSPPFAYLAPHLFEGNVVVEFDHRFVPGDGVEIDGVQKCPVQIENRSFRHSISSVVRGGASLAYLSA
jgi:hypothetical protein